MNNLLLDTCGFIWLSQGGGRLTKETVKLIDQANFVYVSSISAWEIGFLHAKKRITLPMEPEDWFEQVCEEQNVALLNITADIALRANRLPWYHKDPADRLIISTAHINNLSIVTQDQKFQEYNVENYG
ncbi:MAG: type II toxin-antitoxin system VapC family toxin [Planctomycetes bacterium]|nr:type II toxin-antitoxin system VapC family toxin [Planctomycetota bacterium]